MRRIQRWSGRLTIGVGIFGVVLALATVVLLWRARAGFTARAVEISDFATAVNDNAKDRIARADAVLERMQQNARFLLQTIEQLRVNAEQDEKAVLTLLDLEVDIARGLEDSRSLLVSIQSSLQSLSQAVVLLESVSSPMFRVRRPTDSMASDQRQLSRVLLETSEQLATVIEFIEVMDRQKITTALVTELRLSVTRLESRLEEVRAWLDSGQAYLRTTGESVPAARDRLLVWTDATAVTVCLLLVCFTFTQVHLIVYGRSLVLRWAAEGQG